MRSREEQLVELYGQRVIARRDGDLAVEIARRDVDALEEELQQILAEIRADREKFEERLDDGTVIVKPVVRSQWRRTMESRQSHVSGLLSEARNAEALARKTRRLTIDLLDDQIDRLRCEP